MRFSFQAFRHAVEANLAENVAANMAGVFEALTGEAPADNPTVDLGEAGLILAAAVTGYEPGAAISAAMQAPLTSIKVMHPMGSIILPASAKDENPLLASWIAPTFGQAIARVLVSEAVLIRLAPNSPTYTAVAFGSAAGAPLFGIVGMTFIVEGQPVIVEVNYGPATGHAFMACNVASADALARTGCAALAVSTCDAPEVHPAVTPQQSGASPASASDGPTLH